MQKNVLFLCKFFVIFAVLQAIIYVLPVSGLNAWIAGLEAGFFGLEASGISIKAGEIDFVITNSCTGLVSGSILAAIVFSLKKPDLKKKAAMFGIGAALLFLVNLVRIYFVIAGGLAYGA